MGCEIDGEASGYEAEHHIQGLIDSDFDIPLSDQAVVDKEAEEWAVLWLKTASCTPPDFDPNPAHVRVRVSERAAPALILTLTLTLPLTPRESFEP